MKYKIWVNTRSAEIDEKIRKKLIGDHGNVSTGAFNVLYAYSEPEFFRNVLKLEEIKRENEIMKMRTEQLQQLLKDNNMLTHRLTKLEKELDQYKQREKEKRGIK